VAKLIQAAVANAIIRECLLKENYSYKTLGGASKNIRSTDLLLDDFNESPYSLLGGKTGYTILAGYCFTGVFENEDKDRIVTVVLGGDTMTSRFSETKTLVDWSFQNYEWRR
jgi:D-alanyl-D-alanine carboxypeptidase (penicillin-binding protein 5/6)